MNSQPHGERRLYQRGCRCLLCKASNARYSHDYYRRQCQGIISFGACVSTMLTRRRLRQLQIEEVTQAQIARQLGLRNRSLRLHARITVRKAQQIQHFFAALMAEGPVLARAPGASQGG